MKLNRSGVALGLLATCALVLTSCSSDSEASSAESDVANVDCGGKQSLTASGSTAQANAMTRFVEAYEKACSGQTLTYTANGSANGISEFASNKTDFGGTDIPLDKQDSEYAAAAGRCGSEVWNLPTVFGPVAISYNINAVDTLVLDAPTLAKIFNGTITKWNDPAITRLNQSMPPGDITVVYRTDESGTTQTFQDYLEAASDGAWGKGSGKVFNGGVGKGGAGNEGAPPPPSRTPRAPSPTTNGRSPRRRIFSRQSS